MAEVDTRLGGRSEERYRISLDLRGDLIDRLAVQVELSGISRRYLIEVAVEGLLDEFEAIDEERGRPCTCGAATSRIERPHLPRCLLRPAHAKEAVGGR